VPGSARVGTPSDDLVPHPLDLEVEQSVLTRGALQDGTDLARRYRERYRRLVGAVEDAGMDPCFRRRRLAFFPRSLRLSAATKNSGMTIDSSAGARSGGSPVKQKDL